MTLSYRRQELARKLLQGQGPVTVRALAAELGVSPRTVRYDLDELAPWLRARAVGLVRRPRAGIWVEAGVVERAKVTGELQPTLAYEYRLSRAERVKLILIWLLQARRPVTAEWLARRLSVNRSTVLQDLREVERWAKKFDLALLRRPGRGIAVEGTEMKWREAAASLLAEFAGTQQLSRFLAEIEKVGKRKRGGKTILEQALGLVSEGEMRGLEEIVRGAQDRLGLEFADGSLAGLVIHLAVALKRLREGKNISIDAARLEDLRARREYPVACEMAGQVERLGGISIPEAEIGYITLHLLGAKTRASAQGSSACADAARVDAESGELAREFVRRAQALLGVPLEEDAELLAGLAVHLGPAMHRLRYGLSVDNPLLAEIKTRYSEVFAVAFRASRFLEKALRTPLPEEEVGYLAVHLAAALEKRRASRQGPRRAIVVCGSGVGTCQLLGSLLRSRLPEVEVVGMTSADEVTRHPEFAGAGWLISTVPLEVAGKRVAVVSPLPADEDIRALRAVLGLPVAPEIPSAPSARRGRGKGGVSLVLRDVLKREAVMLDREVADWREAVRQAGELLLRAGVVAEGYPEGMVRNVERLGPYIVIAPGIALPHARPEDGARRVGVSMLRLAQPVYFGHPENDPVDLVFGLAGTDSESHLSVLADLVSLVNDRANVRALREASSVEEVMAIVEGLEAKGGGEARDRSGGRKVVET